MIVAKHITPDKRLILAVCDSDLFGKRFEEGKLQLDLTGGFYKGQEMEKSIVAKLISNAYIVNCVGPQSVALALDAKLCSREKVMRVRDVPHCQALVVRE
jgi:uncharacterized protein